MWGLSFEQDRKWKITIDGRAYFLRDYNDEITGYDDELRAIAPDVIYYGGNAYYVTGKYARERGWLVESVGREKFAPYWGA